MPSILKTLYLEDRDREREESDIIRTSVKEFIDARYDTKQAIIYQKIIEKKI